MTNKDNKLKLSRRKALAGIGGIGVASAGAGLGTSAFFTDTETFDDNTITAGELDLRIDWQQLYYGPEENTDNYEPYGEEGYPFVNAHPDHDTTGEQSLDTDELDGFDNEGVVKYSDNDANIQEYLTCETLENFEVPDDFTNGVTEQDYLIDFDDVKPGDCGEVTFSYHLCDNPGYVWLTGDLGEVDPAFAEAVEVRMWYDLNCDSEVQEEDKIIFDWGSLDSVFGELGNDSVQLNPGAYENQIIDEGIEIDDECPFLGKIEWDDDTTQFTVADESGYELSEDEVDDINGDLDTDYDNVVVFTVGDSGEVELGITFSELDGDQPKTVDLELVEGNFGPIEGLCFVSVFGGGAYTFYDPTPLCSTGDTGYRVFRKDPDDYEGPNPPQGGTDHPGISNIEFYYCPEEPEDPPVCFPPDETYCIGFEWCLPVDVDVDEIDDIDDINDLQGASAGFDLGFYTEQCRHNDNPTGPPNGA